MNDQIERYRGQLTEMKNLSGFSFDLVIKGYLEFMHQITYPELTTVCPPTIVDEIEALHSESLKNLSINLHQVFSENSVEVMRDSVDRIESNIVAFQMTLLKN